MIGQFLSRDHAILHLDFYFLSLDLEVKLAFVFLKKISEQFIGRLEPLAGKSLDQGSD